MRSLVPVVGPLVGTALVLASCAADTDHNGADLAFVQEMLPRQEEAVQLAAIAASTSHSESVRILSRHIDRSRRKEMRTLRRWIDDWDADGSPVDDRPARQRLGDVRSAGADDFDQVWLETMIGHHTATMTAAEQEMRDGEFSEAIDLAHDMADNQAVEIDHMKELLDD